ncbi:MAG: hypothetical protein ACREMQ_13860 [Longimicrobiales bacterium]
MYRTITLLGLWSALATSPLSGQAARSPATVQALSIGTTLLGVSLLVAGRGDLDAISTALGAVGIIIGPATGFFYAGETRRGLVSTGIRVGTLATGLVGFGLAWEDNPAGLFLFFPSLLLFTGSIIYDFATVGAAARRNSRLQIGLDPRTQSLRIQGRIEL